MIMRSILLWSFWWKFNISNGMVREPTNQNEALFFSGPLQGLLVVLELFSWNLVGFSLGFCGIFSGFLWMFSRGSCRISQGFLGIFRGFSWGSCWVFLRILWDFLGDFAEFSWGFCGIFLTNLQGFLRIFVEFSQ